MKITITAEIENTDADPYHSTGVTTAMYDRLTDPDTGLAATYGMDDVKIEKASEQ